VFQAQARAQTEQGIFRAKQGNRDCPVTMAHAKTFLAEITAFVVVEHRVV
jgi:hypothetical protein